MNRDTMIAKVREMKERATRNGPKPTVVAMAPIDLMKMRCTHLHGMQLVKGGQLKHGQLMFLAPDEQGNLRAVKP